MTLTCSSEASPPVERYTWFKENRALASPTGILQESYTIKHITQQDAGEYHCDAWNGVGEKNRSPPKLVDVQCEYTSVSQLQTRGAERSQYLFRVCGRLPSSKTE